ncbi:hypothetical protein [Arthrobacter sulfonylureivorans]|uniref:Uncharacterized protein n=1 Tax=Arthrobacter sulfonylureivorans TaxID=2486855 RepID=A0ABY3WEE7_9MICC|nr:hypothetical protein [Arthrobacter sulfonylureivorans]UNK47797.1 hypothetical protein MNQ99_18920 [Arthrobacter sulfonylureivorans]
MDEIFVDPFSLWPAVANHRAAVWAKMEAMNFRRNGMGFEQHCESELCMTGALSDGQAES